MVRDAKEEVDEIIKSQEADVSKAKKNFREDYSRETSRLKKKLILDRVGYGFAATQFINILFYLTGAPFFLIGIVNALKSSLSTTLSSLLKEYSKEGFISRRIITFSGLLFGFSFLFMAFAVSIKSPALFAVSLLFGSLGIVSYGDLFRQFINNEIKKQRFSLLLSKLAFSGIIITTFSLLLAGYLMNAIPITGQVFTMNLFGQVMSFRLYGYLIAFEITALAFILSSYIISKLNINITGKRKSISGFLSEYMKNLRSNTKRVLSNKYLLLLSLASIILAVFYSVINSFMGIYIFREYSHIFLGGFMNVAVMYGAALLFSFFAPVMTAKFRRVLGLAPMFVFGSLLLALLPLTVVYNANNFYAIIVANVLSVFGGAIIGSAQGLIANRLLNEADKSAFYVSSGMITVIPFLILVGILVALPSVIGFLALFEYLAYGIIILLMPLYLLLVFWSTKTKL